MALFANLVTFTQPAGGALGLQTISGVGFEGKALLLWSSLTPTHEAIAGTTQLVAMTDGVEQSVSFLDHPNGATATSAQANQTGRLIYVTNPTTGATPTVRAAATFGAWTSDGFTLTWTTNTVEPLGPPVYHALVLGGPELQAAVKLVQITVNAGQTVVVTGVGFQPESFIVGDLGALTLGGFSDGAPFGGIHGFSFSNATDNVCAWVVGRGVSPTETYSGLHTDRVASVREEAVTGAAELCGSTITATSADGFTLTRVTGTAAVIQPMHAVLCLRGALFHLGTFTAPALAGTLSVPLAFRPGLFLAQTHGATTLGTAVDGLTLMLGAWVDRIAQRGTWIGGVDAASPSVYSRASYAGYLIQTRDPATRAVTCQASLTRSTSSGVTLTFNVTAAMTFTYLALGSVVPRGRRSLFATGGTTGPLSWIELLLKDGD